MRPGPDAPLAAQLGLPADYTLLSEAGRGGMGIVFRARRGDQPVALKLLRAELALDAEAATRFAREANAVRRFTHPNIVELVDAGTTSAGRPFVAYEWLEGTTLWDAGPQSTRRARALGSTLLGALDAAHAAGFLHRDIKPSNVVLANPDEARSLTLIDFGLVLSLRRSMDLASWTRLTETGHVVGTPPYMAPEQIEDGEASVQTDVWAAGVLLYWLVSGREPFAADTVTLRMLKILSEPVEPLAQVAPHVAPSFAAVLDRALARDPQQRWLDCRAMARALMDADVCDRRPTWAPGAPSPTVTK